MERPELALKRVLALAHATIPRCDAAAVTLVRNGRAIPVASTSELARELDSIQCRTGDGPSMDAIRQLQVFNVATGDESSSWPGFSKEAMARGVLSSLSVPLTLGGFAIGALNLYSTSAEAFAGCEAAAVVFGCQAAATVPGALPGIRTAPERPPATEDRTAAV